MRIRCVLVLLLLALALPHGAWATTYYVDRSIGVDTNTGLSETAGVNGPFLRISRCVQVINSLPTGVGHTCLVKNGNYPEPWGLSKSGAAGSPITIKNYTGHAPSITMTGNSISANQLDFYAGSATVPVSWVIVEGFKIENAIFCFHLENVTDFVMRNNELVNCGEGVLGGGLRVTFTNSIIRGRVGNVEHGLYISSGPWTITNNEFYDIEAYSIQLAGYNFHPGPTPPQNAPSAAYGGIHDVLIANNTFAYAHGAAIAVWSACEGSGGCDNSAIMQNIRVVNNIFHENGQSSSATGNPACAAPCGGSGVHFLWSFAFQTRLENNVHFATTTPGANSFISCAATNSQCTQPSTYTATGNSTITNPNMVTAPATVPGTPNFRLTSSSTAAINAGLNLTACGITTDKDGLSRPTGAGTCASPTGAAWEVGAYEFGVSDTTPPAPPTGVFVS